MWTLHETYSNACWITRNKNKNIFGHKIDSTTLQWMMHVSKLHYFCPFLVVKANVDELNGEVVEEESSYPLQNIQNKILKKLFDWMNFLNCIDFK